MEALFRKVLEMSITGAWVILAVILVRFALRRFPKVYSYALWSVAAFRLCCPVSFTSVYSLFSVPHIVSGPVVTQRQMPQAPSVLYGQGDYTAHTLIPVAPDRASGPDWLAIFTVLWAAGVAAMVLYGLICHVRLQLRLRTAVHLRENIWQSEWVDSPFILGFFRPRIYLPYGMPEDRQEWVLAHERCHLKVWDHIVKLLAFGILTVHWFNPLCHVAFWLMGRDMEMRCDEAVVKLRADRHTYSVALVTAASQGKAAVSGPLAFGESAVKSRVKNILRMRKPRAWVAAVALVVCTAAVLACAADPAGKNNLAEGKYALINGETGENAALSSAEIRENKLYLPNEVFDLTTKTWEAAPFTSLQWEDMLQHLEGVAPETLDGCRYMELFVLTDKTLAQYQQEVYRNWLGNALPESTMNGAERSFFLLQQGGSLFACDYLQPAPTSSSLLPAKRFTSRQLVEHGGELDPTTATFTQLDNLMAELLSKPGADVRQKVAENEGLYLTILRHNHIRWYLCHVLATEGIGGEKGELSGLLFADVLVRRSEKPLIEQGSMTAAEYFSRYMEYAEEYYRDEPLCWALDNASGPMVHYLQYYYDYGKE